MMAWAQEMVQQQKMDFVRVSFLIAGHTKFSPDIVFAKIAKSYNRSDIFNSEDLQNVISQHADVTVDHGEIVHDWRENLTKYSKMPGIRSLHDFVFVKNSATGKMVCKTRPLCYEGSFTNATMHIMSGRQVEEDIIPDGTQTYLSKRKLRKISDMKLQHLRQMSRLFIPSDRHFPFLSS